MRVTDKNGLAESGDAYRKSGCAIAKIDVEVVAAIENIAAHDRVAAQLQVQTADPVEIVGVRRQRSLYSAEFNAGAGRNKRHAIHVCCGSGSVRAQRSRIAGGDSVRSELPQGGQALAGGEAGGQCRESRGRRRKAGAGVKRILRDDLLVKAAKEEQ